MKNKIIINIVLVYFVVVSIVLISQLYLNNNSKNMPITETVRLVDRLNNAVVLCKESPVMLVNKRQTIVNDENYNSVPLCREDSFYVPVAFFKQAYGAVVEADAEKGQATIRLENTAVVFKENEKTANVISNSTETDFILKNSMFFENNYAYIPVNAFCELFDKEIFIYNDDMLIISPAEADVVFDPSAEAELLREIEQQVKNLPLVLSEGNLKNLIGVKNPIFSFNSDKNDDTSDDVEEKSVVLSGNQSDKFAFIENYVYAISANKLSIINSDENTLENAVSQMQFPKGFSANSVLSYNDMLYVLGQGENAEMPVSKITFEDTTEETSQQTLTGKDDVQTVPGNKFFILCYDTAQKTTPQLKRWFCADGSLDKKQLFDNMLCVAVKKNAFELVNDNTYDTPSYCDLSVETQFSFDEIKYIPEMKDTAYTSVFRFDLAEIDKAVDAETFLGVGNDYVFDQNTITFAAESALEEENLISNLYRVNLSSGAYSKNTLNGKLKAIERVNNFNAVLVDDGGRSVLYTLNNALDKTASSELSLKNSENISCINNKAYITDKNKKNMLIVELSQVYSETDLDMDEPETILEPQEKALLDLTNISFIKPYETSAVGFGKNAELNNAEISMWALKDTAVKTSGDVIGDFGTNITPLNSKGIVENEIAFDLSLFVKENDVATEKYRGAYIYNISENSTPSLKGRITHNADEEINKIITDIVYFNEKYFTLSENMVCVNANDETLTRLYSINIE